MFATANKRSASVEAYPQTAKPKRFVIIDFLYVFFSDGWVYVQVRICIHLHKGINIHVEDNVGPCWVRQPVRNISLTYARAHA